MERQKEIEIHKNEGRHGEKETKGDSETHR
jgi:hypothetical protein